MKVLLVSHSSRQFFSERATPNNFEARFDGRSLSALPDLRTLPPIEEASPYPGCLTLWELASADDRQPLRFLCRIDFDCKIQSATFVDDKLVVYSDRRIDVLDQSLKPIREITHPWMAGGHTVYSAGDDMVWVSAAAANALLKFRLSDGDLVERWNVPDTYGKGYEVNDDVDLRRHFIPTDLQPTHVNSAVPVEEGLLITLWIPGVVGIRDDAGNWRELVRGLLGCHGAKPFGAEEILVTDSCRGTLVFCDRASGRIIRRCQLDSQWLHDAEPLGNGHIAVTAGDTNRLWLVDSRTGDITHSQNLDGFGASPVFVNAIEVSQEWQRALHARRLKQGDVRKKLVTSPRMRWRFFYRHIYWKWNSSTMRHQTFGADGIDVETALPCENEYLVRSEPLDLPAGHYRLNATCAVRKGGIAVGPQDSESELWLADALIYDPVRSSGDIIFRLRKSGAIRLVIAAANVRGQSAVEFRVREVSVSRLQRVGWLRLSSLFSDTGSKPLNLSEGFVADFTELARLSVAGRLDRSLADEEIGQSPVSPRDGKSGERHFFGRMHLGPGNFEFSTKASIDGGCLEFSVSIPPSLPRRLLGKKDHSSLAAHEHGADSRLQRTHFTLENRQEVNMSLRVIGDLGDDQIGLAMEMIEISFPDILDETETDVERAANETP